MMNILSAQQIRSADAYTIEHEPITSVDLMERASQTCVTFILRRFDTSTPFAIFAGTGNNGGDGLVIARLLTEKGYPVSTHLVHFSDRSSSDNQTNLERLNKMGVDVHHIHRRDELIPVEEGTIVIDALVGTGLTRPLSGLLLDVAQFINDLSGKVIAIDLPSGLFSETDNSEHLDKIIRADYTLSFAVPKLSFFLPSLHSFLGEWHILDIGLDQEFIRSQETPYRTTDYDEMKTVLRKRSPHAHKGNFGHALIIAGSYGKIGAGLLSTKACIGSGAGLVSAFIPACGYTILQSSAPEAMVYTSNQDEYLDGNIDYNPFAVMGIGPGLGTRPETAKTLEYILTETNIPLVIDADGINLISQSETMQRLLGSRIILTPHVKEFERLFGTCSGDFERLQRQREASRTHQCIILLKGRYTSISDPDGNLYFNTSGNSGMATGGSGDVLTGIITGLVSQGYSLLNAARLGAYLHGVSGDFAAERMGYEAMNASHLIEHLGDAFKTLYE